MVDLLAVAPHPDDAELGMGGTLARHAALGYRVGVLDLTAGEMGSNGTPAVRLAEGEAAARQLGLCRRENLGLPDGGLSGADPDQVRALAEALRRLRPQVLCYNWGEDRHPDHRGAFELVRGAVFKAGLVRYQTGHERWQPERSFCYFINSEREPDFIVDISPYYAHKEAAIAAHVSQFGQGEVATRLNRTFGLPHAVRGRDMLFGARIGCEYGEGFVHLGPMRRDDLLT